MLSEHFDHDNTSVLDWIQHKLFAPMYTAAEEDDLDFPNPLVAGQPPSYEDLHAYIDEHEIPSQQNITFATWIKPIPLPAPSDVRKQATDPTNLLKTSAYVDVVLFPALNLVVKYSFHGIEEGQILWLLRRKTSLPVPEVYGWICDGRETFIYMEYIEGKPLDELWPGLDDAARLSIAKQLAPMIMSLRNIRQSQDTEPYIGAICHRPILDQLWGHSGGEPLNSVAAFNDAVFALGSHVPGCSSAEFRAFLPDTAEIVFTHTDLHLSNIIISPEDNKVLAIIDWANAGWYPIFWEYAKTSLQNQWYPEWQDLIPIFLSPFKDVSGLLYTYEMCGVLI